MTTQDRTREQTPRRGWPVLAGFFLLITGKYPRGLFDLLLGINRWLYRVLTYVGLMHDQYTPFRLDQGPNETVDPAHPLVPAYAR
jgi:hypothetical protein